MMKKNIIWVAIGLPLITIMAGCGISRQVKEAKTVGKCRFAVGGVDSMYVAGYDVQTVSRMDSLTSLNPLRYPRLAAGLLAKTVPFDARIILDITNPTDQVAALNQLAYKILLEGTEFASGTLDQRIEVAPNGGTARVPIRIGTNAYALLANRDTRVAFTGLVRNLAGDQRAQPTTVTLKVKPTLMLGNKAVDYPGYISLDKQITSQTLRTTTPPSTTSTN